VSPAVPKKGTAVVLLGGTDNYNSLNRLPKAQPLYHEFQHTASPSKETPLPSTSRSNNQKVFSLTVVGGALKTAAEQLRPPIPPTGLIKPSLQNMASTVRLKEAGPVPGGWEYPL
jgi:hypothetical protein